MSERSWGKKFCVRLAACLIGGVAMAAVTALLPALSRDDPWRALTDEMRGQAGDNEVIALTGGDVWARVATTWIDVPVANTLVSLREQEVRSVVKLPRWAALPPVVESGRRYESIATGIPFKCLTGCRVMDSEKPLDVASTITLARPTWNGKTRSVPTGLNALNALANVGLWTLVIAGVTLLPASGKKKHARSEPGVGEAA